MCFMKIIVIYTRKEQEHNVQSNVELDSSYDIISVNQLTEFHH